MVMEQLGLAGWPWQGVRVALASCWASHHHSGSLATHPPLALRGHVNHGDTHRPPGGACYPSDFWSSCAGARLLPLRLDHLWERMFSMAQLLPERLKLPPLSIAHCVPEGCLARRPPTGVGSPLPWTCSLSPVKDHSGGWSLRKGLAPHGNAPHRSSSLKLLAEVGGADCGLGLLLGLTEACGAWHGPSQLMFPDPPPPAPLLAWGMPRDCLAVGLSHPLPLNFLPTPRPFCPHVQRPRPLGLEFSRDPPLPGP